ncbi:glucose 1-dehydrogenase [Lyngbya aestuarii]|uniref:glucose 1-dehydrogenase n=1 Tax=Lyngbya aestuarii TaxID=118322 RepID=UPI00403D83B1
MSLIGKVALITGGGQGIGKAIAQRFLKEGLTVVIAEIDQEAGKETEAEYSNLGKIRFVYTNIACEETVKQAIAKTIELFGKLDILVNNAAIANPENAPITQLSLESWNRLIATNLTGSFLCTKYAVPYLRNHQGVIINIASTRALMSEPHTEAYSTAKGGIVAFTHALANSLGPEIRVNCISPGWIAVQDWQKQASRQEPQLTQQDYQQHPVGRVGKPEDVAAMAFYLASPESDFITGANFIVDGGMTRKMIYL